MSCRLMRHAAGEVWLNSRSVGLQKSLLPGCQANLLLVQQLIGTPGALLAGVQVAEVSHT
jgi:hypothetical protein